jgi:hypothetical protein
MIVFTNIPPNALFLTVKGGAAQFLHCLRHIYSPGPKHSLGIWARVAFLQDKQRTQHSAFPPHPFTPSAVSKRDTKEGTRIELK